MNKISQKLYEWTLTGQGTIAKILVMVRILRDSDLRSSREVELWSWSNLLCYVTLYYHCQYINYHPISRTQYEGEWAAWRRSLRPECFSGCIGFISFPLDVQISGAQCRFKGSPILKGDNSFSLFAVIQGGATQIALEMEETGQFHLVDLVRHVLSGWLPKWLWKLIQILITTVSYWNVTTWLSAI